MTECHWCGETITPEEDGQTCPRNDEDGHRACSIWCED